MRASFSGSPCFELHSFIIWKTQGDLQCSKGQVGSHEIISVCVQDEAPIKKEKEVNIVHLNTNAPKRHFSKLSSHTDANKENSKCYFSDKACHCHMKRDYTRTSQARRNQVETKTMCLWGMGREY
ncbi:unnamed protein product [Prunus armeniaca]|uniref:Uncharacterized protein n=1 Tax=Prunus armeniaca TaxID=36596 RepID=A0A6J5WUK5_PRUAR|nr:unnamed protein product [Prunus armeniaca]